MEGRAWEKTCPPVSIPGRQRRRGGDMASQGASVRRRKKGTIVKYVLMFVSEPALAESTDPELAKAVYTRVYEWFGEHSDQIADSGAELHPVETATTVRTGGLVVDGPFNEAKEVIGGVSVIHVPRLDAAPGPAEAPPPPAPP